MVRIKELKWAFLWIILGFTHLAIRADQYHSDSSGNTTLRTSSLGTVPVIQAQPQLQVVQPGDVATFSIALRNPNQGTTYQWRFNSINIPGATGDSVVLANVTAERAGAYSVLVNNSLGSVVSDPALLMFDTDGDFLPDSWEQTYFGNLSAQSGGDDPDHDGATNVEEFLNGTDPSSDTSFMARLTLTSEGGGSLTASPAKASYLRGESVTLTATPEPSYLFESWSGDLDSGSSVLSLMITSNITLRARFLPPPPEGLQAWWRAENSAQDTVGTNHGATVNGATYTEGRVGKAFLFDGVNDSVEVPDSPELRPASLTLETWVKFDVADGIRILIAKPLGDGNADSYGLWLQSGSLNASVSDAGGIFPILSIPFSPTSGTWYHLAYSFDDSSKEQVLYVNGSLVARGTSQKSILYDTHPLLLGRDSESGIPSWFFKGSLDEPALYGRALSPKEIAGLYQMGTKGKTLSVPYFTATTLPIAAPGFSYAQSIATLGGTLPIAFDLVSGSLPSGLSLSSSGLLSGTSAVPGVSSFSVRATDSRGNSRIQDFDFQVIQPSSPPGIVAWWKAEDDAQDTISENHGSLESGTTFTKGRVRRAFAFDGTKNYVSVSEGPDLRTPSMTLEAWVKFSSTNSEQTIFSKPIGTGGLASYRLYFTGNKLVGVRSDGTKEESGLSTLFTPAIDTWHHVALTFNESLKEQFLYLDGVQAARSFGGNSMAFDTHPLLLGCDADNNTFRGFLHGALDESTLYDRALLPGEIAAIYRDGMFGKSSSGPYVQGPGRLDFGIQNRPYAQTFVANHPTSRVHYNLQGGAFPPGLTLTPEGFLSGTPFRTGRFAFVIRAQDSSGFTDQSRSIEVYPQSIAPDGMVAWWRGDGDARDSVGVNQGTTAKGTRFGDGVAGKSFGFDGIEGAVVIPDSPDLRQPSITVETWARFEANDGIQFLIAKPLTGSSSDSFAIWLQYGNLKACVADAAGYTPELSSPFLPELGRWYHLAYTFDDATKHHALFIDGVSAASGWIQKSILYDAQPLLLGRDNEVGAPSSFFKGSLDETAIYKRALDTAEIAAIHSAGPAGKIPGPYFQTDAALPEARLGRAYSQTLVSSGGTVPRQNTVTGGLLPPGLELSASGILSGVPIVSGSTSFRVGLIDANGLGSERIFQITVASQTSTPPGLIAWWRGENTAQDAIGAHHGSLSHGTSFASGRVGQAFLLDGVNDSIEIPDSPTFRLSSFTLETWAQFDTWSGLQSILGKPLGNGSFDSFAIWLSDGGLHAAVSEKAQFGPILTVPLYPEPGRWYHIAYSFDSITHEQALYVDGLLRAHGLSNITIEYDDHPVLLGGDIEYNSPTYFLKGRLDEVAFYRRSLASSEVAAIHSAGSLGKTLLTPFERWKFDQLGDASYPATGDPDGDGLSLLTEYALNLSGVDGEFGLWPGLTLLHGSGDEMMWSIIIQRDPARSDVDVAIQSSDSVSGPWLNLASSVRGASFSGIGYVGGDGLGVGLKRVEIRDTAVTTSSQTRFLRLLVTQ